MNLLTLFSIAYSFTIGLSESSYVLWERERTPYSGYYYSEKIETDFSVQLNFWRFYVGGSTETTSEKEITKTVFNVGTYSPIVNNYSFRFGYSGKYLSAGFEYHCLHPTMVQLQDIEIKNKKDAAYQRIFIKFNHELRFK